jgi:hypothetical protein
MSCAVASVPMAARKTPTRAYPAPQAPRRRPPAVLTQHAAGDSTAARQTWQRAMDILDRLGHADADRLRAKLHVGSV